jgi:hypothetical protein
MEKLRELVKKHGIDEIEYKLKKIKHEHAKKDNLKFIKKEFKKFPIAKDILSVEYTKDHEIGKYTEDLVIKTKHLTWLCHIWGDSDCFNDSYDTIIDNETGVKHHALHWEKLQEMIAEKHNMTPEEASEFINEIGQYNCDHMFEPTN